MKPESLAVLLNDRFRARRIDTAFADFTADAANRPRLAETNRQLARRAFEAGYAAGETTEDRIRAAAREHYEFPNHRERVPGCSFCDEDAEENRAAEASLIADGEGPETP